MQNAIIFKTILHTLFEVTTEGDQKQDRNWEIPVLDVADTVQRRFPFWMAYPLN